MPQHTLRQPSRPSSDEGPVSLVDSDADKRDHRTTGPRVSRMTLRTVGLLTLAVGVALVIAWASRGSGNGGFGNDESLPSVEKVAASPIASDVLANSGPSDVRSVTMMAYDEGMGPSDGGAVPKPIEVGVSDVVVSPGEVDSRFDPSVSGAWRIRICRSPGSRKRDFDRAVAHLKAHGVETETVLRSTFYFLYSRQTFPSKEHPLCLAVLKRIKELGVTFAEQSGTDTDFHDAYALMKRSGN